MRPAPSCRLRNAGPTGNSDDRIGSRASCRATTEVAFAGFFPQTLRHFTQPGSAARPAIAGAPHDCVEGLPETVDGSGADPPSRVGGSRSSAGRSPLERSAAGSVSGFSRTMRKFSPAIGAAPRRLGNLPHVRSALASDVIHRNRRGLGAGSGPRLTSLRVGSSRARPAAGVRAGRRNGRGTRATRVPLEVACDRPPLRRRDARVVALGVAGQAEAALLVAPPQEASHRCCRCCGPSGRCRTPSAPPSRGPPTSRGGRRTRAGAAHRGRQRVAQLRVDRVGRVVVEADRVVVAQVGILADHVLRRRSSRRRQALRAGELVDVAVRVDRDAPSWQLRHSSELLPSTMPLLIACEAFGPICGAPGPFWYIV